MSNGINYVSYSGYKLYIQCPFAYWNRYVNNTTLADAENGLGTLYGSTIGLIFEAFYRDRIWKRVDYLEALQGLVEPYLKKAIKDQEKQGRIIDWSDEEATKTYKNQGELVADIRDSIPRGVQTIRQNKLMGPFMEAEMKLDCRFGGYTIGGRADFVVQRTQPHGDLVILDGKGSKHRAKYVDGHALKEGAAIEGVQLKWYAFLYRERKKRTPDALGYIFWKFGGEQAMEWVPFKAMDLDDLKDEVLATLTRIDTSVSRLYSLSGKPQACEDLRQELFPAQPGDGCRLCSYVSVCEEGQKKTKSFKRARLELPEGVNELTLGLYD
jgi:hypothetical protein